MDLIKSLGELAVGSRLKRLSDFIMKDGIRIYQSNNVDFQPKWFLVFYALSQNKKMSVTEIANELGLAHPTVSQTVKEMEKKGLLDSRPSPHDARKRELSLSQRGQVLLPKMEPIWRDISNAIHRILVQNEHSLLRAIEEVESRFEEKRFFDWVQEETRERQLQEVQILEYHPDLKTFFKELNYYWIEKYFEVEDADRKMLEHPEEQIISNGGRIIFAQLNGSVVGTCALIKIDDLTYELAKMAVSEQVQGRQIGKKLGLEIIRQAKELGASRLVLESNKKLIPALNLYEKLGFTVLDNDLQQSIYCRVNIKMELSLVDQDDRG